MSSFLTIFALSAGVVSAVVPSAYPVSSTACPSVPTVTSRPTYPGTYYDYITRTVTQTSDTYTRSVSSYNATSIMSSPGLDPSTSTTYLTITDTSYLPTSTRDSQICTSTSTASLIYTTTVYTGTYVPSSVSSWCPTSTTTDAIYTGGTITTTVTSTSYPPPTFVTSYIPAGTTTITNFDSQSTETGTVTLVNYASSGVITNTYDVSCSTTVFTATATGVTSTQAAKCAPTNLIYDISYIEYYNSSQSLAPGQETVDASTCCQLCADNPSCAVSRFNAGFCAQRIAPSVEGEGTCGVAERVIIGDFGFEAGVAQAGCGRIERQDLS